MTIKEFSEKYGIDRGVVYNATWLIPNRPYTYSKNRDYDEQELYKAVRTTMKNRISRLQDGIDRAQRVLDCLDKV